MLCYVMLGQTSNLGHVEPINCGIRSVISFLPNEAKYTLSINLFNLLV